MSDVREYSPDELEQELRMEQLRADIKLKKTLAAAEWPKVFTAALIAVAAIFTVFGYSIGRHH